MSVRDGPTGNLDQLTADLRLATPPSWTTATGTGVGIDISSSIVSDLSTLTFTPTANVPSDASAGDELYYYVSVPTEDLNLSDWRINLGGFAIQSISGWGASVGTVGDNTVFQRAYGVGDGSGGIASATAPGAAITLQYHGPTSHTAYSGELEGRALAQVTGMAGDATTAQLQAETTARTNADNALGRRIDAKQDTLTQKQQIGLLNISSAPSSFAYTNSDSLNRTFSLLVDNPELLTGDIWYTIDLGGVPVVGARTKWTANTLTIDMRFASSANRSSALVSIGNNGFLSCEMRFYDAASGGNVVDSLRFNFGAIEESGGTTAASDSYFVVGYHRTSRGASGGRESNIEAAPPTTNFSTFWSARLPIDRGRNTANDNIPSGMRVSGTDLVLPTGIWQIEFELFAGSKEAGNTPTIQRNIINRFEGTGGSSVIAEFGEPDDSLELNVTGRLGGTSPTSFGFNTFRRSMLVKSDGRSPFRFNVSVAAAAVGFTAWFSLGSLEGVLIASGS